MSPTTSPPASSSLERPAAPPAAAPAPASPPAPTPPLPPRPPLPGPRHQPGPLALLRAELARTRCTATWGLPVIVLLFSAQALVVAHSARTAEGWNDGVLAWMGTYPTAFALPMGALTGAMAAWREQRWREGGTAWRATDPRLVVVVRVGVLSASALASQVLLLAPVLVDALVRGEGWGPWPRYVSFALVMWVSVASAATWGLALAQRLGGLGAGLAPGLALVWSAAGAVRAEAATWWAEPWTWGVRPVLPLLGIHANNLALEAGSPAWDYPVLPALALTGAAGALGLLLALLGAGRFREATSGSVGRARRAGAAGLAGSAAAGPAGTTASTHPAGAAAVREHAPGAPEQPGRTLPHGPAPRPSPQAALQAAPQAARTPPAPAFAPGPRTVALAVAVSLPWGLWLLLGVLLIALVSITRAAYDTSYSLPLLTLVALPTASCVAGATAWRTQEPAWRVLVQRARPAALSAAAVGWAMVLLGLVLVPAWAVASWGLPLSHPLPPELVDLGTLDTPAYVLLVMPFVAFMVTTTSYVLAQVAGTVPMIAVSLWSLLSGLVIAGNTNLLTTSTWWLAPWGWAESAGAFPGRWGGVAGCSLLLGCAALGASGLLGLRVAARQGTASS